MGIRQITALAASQSGEARKVRHRVRALRHGRGHAVRHYESAQVKRSVCAMGHKWMWNPALGGLPPEEFSCQGRPAAGGRSGQVRRHLRDLRSTRRPSLAVLGGKAGIARGHPHPGGRVRRALGCDRRGSERRRRGERRRHLYVHHRVCEACGVDPRRLRRGTGQRASAVHRRRSGSFGHGRHF